MHRHAPILIAAAAGLFAWACSPAPAQPTTAGESKPLANEGEPPAAIDQCEEDADCTISCAPPTGCCGELCDCTTPYTNARLTEIRERMNVECSDVECPVASCPYPTREFYAVCEAERCVSKSRPLSRAE